MARRRPWLAARAVDKVVLGPGEKLIAVASASRANSSAVLMLKDSCLFMGLTVILRPIHDQYSWPDHLDICIGSGRQYTERLRMLTRTSSQSLTEQLSARFAERIRDRLLAPGARLPSVRNARSSRA